MNNNDYWAGRRRDIFDSAFKEKRIKEMYRQSYRNIEKQINELYEKLAAGNTLTTTELYQTDRFLALLRAIREENKDIRSSLSYETETALKKAYKDTFTDVKEMFGEDTSWSIQNSKHLESVLKTKWSGSNYSKRIWDNTDKLSQRIEAAVVDCVTGGKSYERCTKQIMQEFNIGFSNASRVVRTELAHIMNQGAVDTYKEAGCTEVEWYGAPDERQCDICGEMHGKIYPIDKAPTVAHPNCRCTLLPVINLDKRDMHEKTEESSQKTLTNGGNGGIIKSGGVSGARNPFGEKAKEHANRYYESVRAMKTDVSHIAKTTGYSEDEIQKVKDFIFYDKHDLGGNEPQRFDPDYMMSESWQRLINGTPEKHDLTLINHEIMERGLILQGYSQEEAHIITSKKYNYSKEAGEFYDKIKKYKD